MKYNKNKIIGFIASGGEMQCKSDPEGRRTKKGQLEAFYIAMLSEGPEILKTSLWAKGSWHRAPKSPRNKPASVSQLG